MLENSPSSLLGGELAGNQSERPGESKPETSDLTSNPSVKTGDASKKYDDKEQEEQPDTSTKSHSEKSSFSETTKKPPRMSSVDDYTMLPEGYVPKDEDVICSWARQNHSHPGNEKFRIMINEYASTYLNVTTKYQKSEVIAKIVAEVRSKSPGGGFVKKDFYSNRWYEVGDEKARDKVGHAIRKAAVGLGKKLHGNKRQAQSSVAKRQQMKNKARELEQMNAMNMNPNDFMSKAALMNAGMGLDGGFSGLSNEMGLSSMNMGMGVNRSALMGGMRNPGLMGAMGMNGMGMNSLGPMSYSRELEEMLMMNRLRSEVNGPTDSSLLGLSNFGKAAGDSGGLSGRNMMAGMDQDSLMLEELQRRRLRLDAAAKKEEAINMLRDSERMSRWADKGNTTNKPSMNDSSVELSGSATGLSGMNGGALGGGLGGGLSSNAMNSGMGLMGLGGASGNVDGMNGNNLDSMATSSLLSKLAAGNGMQGATNFGNNSGLGSSLMTNNLNSNAGTLNDAMGDNHGNGQFPISNSGLGGQQSYNYDMP